MLEVVKSYYNDLNFLKEDYKQYKISIEDLFKGVDILIKSTETHLDNEGWKRTIIDLQDNPSRVFWIHSNATPPLENYPTLLHHILSQKEQITFEEWLSKNESLTFEIYKLVEMEG